MFRFIAAAAVALVACSAISTSATAASFYEGKTLNVVIGFSPGGGFDAYGRLIARHMGKHIPGNPTIIAQNMPGAGSMKAVQYLSKTAPQNGTVITIFNPGVIVRSLTEPDKVTVDFTKIRFIGNATSDVRVCYMWHSTGLKTFEDVLAAKEIILGATNKSSSSYVNSALLRNVFGANIKHIVGYPGSAEQRLAIERGELQGDCGAWGSIPGDWIKSNKAVPFIRYSTATAEGMPPLPYVMDKARSKEETQILKMVLVSSEIGRPFAVGPDVPEDRLKILREAFNKTVKDKDFLAEATQSRREIIGPTTGEQVEATIKELYETPKSVIAKVADAVK